MNKIVTVIIIVMIVGVGAFYGGVKYGGSKFGARGQKAGGLFANLTPAERQAKQKQFGAGFPGQPVGEGLVLGKIISRDDKTFTVKLNNGGSKIVIFSNETQVTKSIAGVAEDLQAGQDVVASGSMNQDGSLVAKSIQLRPAELSPLFAEDKK